MSALSESNTTDAVSSVLTAGSTVEVIVTEYKHQCARCFKIWQSKVKDPVACASCKDRSWRKQQKWVKSTKPRNESRVSTVETSYQRHDADRTVHTLDSDESVRDKILKDFIGISASPLENVRDALTHYTGEGDNESVFDGDDDDDNENDIVDASAIEAPDNGEPAEQNPAISDSVTCSDNNSGQSQSSTETKQQLPFSEDEFEDPFEKKKRMFLGE